MTKENRSAWLPYLREPVSAEPSAEISDSKSPSEQKTWERAHRLYAIGEMLEAAQLFAQLATSRHAEAVGPAREAIHG
jgi:hypothetical protein